MDDSKRIKVSWRVLKIVGVIVVVALTLKFGIEQAIISVVTFGVIGFAIARAKRFKRWIAIKMVGKD